MRILLSILYCFITASSFASNIIWSGDTSKITVKNSPSINDLKVIPQNGGIQISGYGKDEKTSYLKIEINTLPFSTKNNLLAIDMGSDNPKTTEGVYIRAVDSNGENVLSFQNWKNPLLPQKQQYLFKHGKSSQFIWESWMVKASEDSTINKIVIYLGAKGCDKLMSINLGKIELLEQQAPVCLPKLPGKKIKTGYNSKGTASLHNHQFEIIAIADSPKVSYCSIRVPFDCDFSIENIIFQAHSSTEIPPDSIYVRGYDKKNQCVMSYSNWKNNLTKFPQTFNLVPDKNCNNMTWEKSYIHKDNDHHIKQIEFIIGAKNKRNILFNVIIKNLKKESRVRKLQNRDLKK